MKMNSAVVSKEVYTHVYLSKVDFDAVPLPLVASFDGRKELWGRDGGQGLVVFLLWHGSLES